MSEYSKRKFSVDVHQNAPDWIMGNGGNVGYVIGDDQAALQKDADDPEKILIKLKSLVRRIEAEIELSKEQKEKYRKMERYSHKITVLHATKNYLCGNIGIDTLEEYKRVYPKWDKAFDASNMKNLINEAIVFKEGQEPTTPMRLW